MVDSLKIKNKIMQKYFEDKKTYAMFRNVVKDMPTENKASFIGVVSRAYHAKQTSDEELPTYQITLDELGTIWESFENRVPITNKIMQKHYDVKTLA